MDPLQNTTQTSTSESSLRPKEETPKEGKSTSQPSFSEIQNLGSIKFNPSPGSNYFTPLPEELRHLQYRDETTQERQWERSALPQRNKTFIGNIRQKTLNHMAPYRIEREGRISFWHDKEQNGCKCHYCQIEKEGISKNQEKNSSSWKVLLQGFSQLTLNPGSGKDCPLPEELPKKQ